jgi:hypothetical protein
VFFISGSETIDSISKTRVSNTDLSYASTILAIPAQLTSTISSVFIRESSSIVELEPLKDFEDDIYFYFMSEMSKPRYYPLVQKIKAFVDDSKKSPQRSNKSIHELMDKISPNYHDDENLVDGLEMYLMEMLYEPCFLSVCIPGQIDDYVFNQRISILNSISFKMSYLGIEMEEVLLETLLKDAGFELIELDFYKCPKNKLACLERCHQKVVDFVQRCESQTRNNDESTTDLLLPFVIYMIIRYSISRQHQDKSTPITIKLEVCTNVSISFATQRIRFLLFDELCILKPINSLLVRGNLIC